jgi:hypothetical protein
MIPPAGAACRHAPDGLAIARVNIEPLSKA